MFNIISYVVSLSIFISEVSCIFIRKNGVLVGSVYKDVKGPVFPTVAVHSQNEEYVSY